MTMTSSRLCALLVVPVILQGCATYSFAPPRVETSRIAAEGQKFNTNCSISIERDKLGDFPNGKPIKHDIDGASNLADNFLLAYRCAARQVANGRQHFEIPTLLTTLGGVTAAAFGAPAGVAIGTGAATAGLNSAKSYYAPRDKLPILAAAVDAITCVKNQSVATDAYGSTLITKAAGLTAAGAPIAAGAAAGTGSSVAISAIDQYFTLIETALYLIENVAAQRLSSVGSYAPDALITEFKNIQKQQDDAKAAAEQGDDKAAADANAAAIVTKAKPETEADAKDTDITMVTPSNTGAPVGITKEALPSFLNSGETPGAVSNEFAAKLKMPGTILTLDDNGDLNVGNATTDQQTKVRAKNEVAAAERAVSTTLLYIGQLQPKLNECVLRSKL
jgi:hypothetical protein